MYGIFYITSGACNLVGKIHLFYELQNFKQQIKHSTTVNEQHSKLISQLLLINSMRIGCVCSFLIYALTLVSFQLCPVKLVVSFNQSEFLFG